MPYTIEVRVSRYAPTKGRGSVSVTLPDNQGGFTISNIVILDSNGRTQVKLPALLSHGVRHPAITVRGELKQRIIAAVTEAFRTAEL